MAGRGPAPKTNAIRRNVQNQMGFEQITAEPSPQPELPTLYRAQLTKNGPRRVKVAWPKATQDWWAMWGGSPLMRDATADDWSFLMDTALIHAEFWRGDMKVAGELRLRVAKFGATPEDRLRLKKQFAPPEPEGEDGPKKSGARARRGGLVAV
jgi:hypothetical protein